MTISEFIKEYGIVQVYIVNKQEIKTVSDNPSDKFWNMLIGTSGEIMFFVEKVKPIKDGLRSELEAEFKDKEKNIVEIRYVPGLTSIQVVFGDKSFSVSKKYGYIKLNNGKFYWYKKDEMLSGKMYDAEGDYYIKVGNDKYSIMASKSEYSGIGIYWSWDKEAAEPHWGYDQGEEILLIGKITEDSINVEQTLLQNMSLSDWEEKEITLLDNAKVKIIGVEYNDKEYMFNNGVVVKASSIFDKFLDLYSSEAFFKLWVSENVDSLREQESEAIWQYQKENNDEEPMGGELNKIIEEVDKYWYEWAWNENVPTFDGGVENVYRKITVKEPLKFIEDLKQGKLHKYEELVMAKEDNIDKDKSGVVDTKEAIEQVKEPKEIKRKSEEEKIKWWSAKAITDPLTQLPNRFGSELIVKTLKNQIKAIAEFDIDHFKNINDTYGHDIGDEVLKVLADYLRDKLIMVRQGGEEFVGYVIGDFKDINEIENYLNELRVGISELKFKEKDLKITATIGFMEFNKKENIDDMIKKIDQALYCGKESGRNCTVMYDEEMSEGVCPAHTITDDGEVVKNDKCNGECQEEKN